MIYVGFSRRRSLLGKIIRLVTSGNVDHAFLTYVENRHWVTYGALSKGLVKMPIEEFVKSREIVSIYSTVGFTLDTGLKIVSEEPGSKNVGYNYSGLLGMVGVEIERRLKIRNPINYLDNRKREFCSEWVLKVINASLKAENKGPFLPYQPNTVDPEMLEKACASNPTLFKREEALERMIIP